MTTQPVKRKIYEESVLFFSVLKWVIFSSLIGAVVGASTALFLKILYWSVQEAGRFPLYYFFVPLGLFTSALIIHYFEKGAEGYGIEKVIEAVHKNSGKMRTSVVPIKLAATVITTATGGSVGQVGPCAQIGAAIASFLGGLFRFDDADRKKLVICGISAGFASVLGAPVAGAIFGVEVLIVGGLLYEVLLPSFMAGLISYQVSSSLGITYFDYPVALVPYFSETFLLEVVFAGVFFGICAAIFIGTLKAGHVIAKKWRMWPPLKGLVGGAILVMLTSVFSWDYLGLGLRTIEKSIQGATIDGYAFFIKGVFTSVSFASGGTGGIITPIIFVGATAGNLFGSVFGLDKAAFAAIGLVSVLAGAANTPIAASILCMELFGPGIVPYAAVACVISFLMAGHWSVFPTQRLAMKKSESLDVEMGGEIKSVKAEVSVRRKTLLSVYMKMRDMFRRRESGKHRD